MNVFDFGRRLKMLDGDYDFNPAIFKDSYGSSKKDRDYQMAKHMLAEANRKVSEYVMSIYGGPGDAGSYYKPIKFVDTSRSSKYTHATTTGDPWGSYATTSEIWSYPSDTTGSSLSSVTSPSVTTPPSPKYPAPYMKARMREHIMHGLAEVPAQKQDYKLPDGAILRMDADGNYQIDDTDAKVVYKANRVRRFSPHLNASDMLADFVQHAGELGVARADVMNLPISLFVAWLVIEAAERDGDPCDLPPISQSDVVRRLKKPQCLNCGRFVKQLHARNGFMYCNPQHAQSHLALAI